MARDDTNTQSMIEYKCEMGLVSIHPHRLASHSTRSAVRTPAIKPERDKMKSSLSLRPAIPDPACEALLADLAGGQRKNHGSRICFGHDEIDPIHAEKRVDREQ